MMATRPRALAVTLAALLACGRGEPPRAATAEPVPGAFLRGTLLARDSATLVFVACGTTRERTVVEGRFSALRAALTAVAGGVRDSAYVEVEADTADGRVTVRDTRFATSYAEGTRCDRPGSMHEWEAWGNEPFWHITVDGRDLMLERSEAPLETSFVVDSTSVNAGLTTMHASRDVPNARPEWRGPLPERAIIFSALRADCRDGMSDAWYPYRVEIRYGKTALHGCARR